ncbi:MAG: prepilin-type N-terminal cleavage/methylation domain-containing protein [Deltaproteobacteria bacterium]|nr:prepilin-type N-terminal cleavage/methylation domain-containing protein [Deltaproteobacteria bacterium]
MTRACDPRSLRLPARARARAPGAFTLIELLVALSIAAAIAASAMAMFLVVRLSSLEAAARAQMARDAQVALDTLERDLRGFGAGVPLGVNDDAGSPAEGQSLLPIVRVGRSDNLVFLGDLPYPNAELPGLASLAYVGASGSPAHRIAVTSETSGPCIPPFGTTGILACRTSATTLLPGLQAAANCDGGAPALVASSTAAQFTRARTCPWGMHKWLHGSDGLVYLTLVAVDGTWIERRSSSGGIGNEDVDGKFVGTHLDHAFPEGGEFVGRARFFANAGGGYVATLDRVLFAVEQTSSPGTPCGGTAGGDCALRRRQCWGRLQDPSASSFPAAGTTSFIGSSTTSLLNCAAGQTQANGTNWETVLSGIEDLDLRYFEGATTQLVGSGTGQALTAAQAGRVRAVEVEVRLRRRVPGTQPARFVSDVVRRRFFLPNQQ